MKQASAQSKGKVIISGEHSVVYGEPALVGGIELFREVVLRSPHKRAVTHSPFVENILQIFETKYGVKIENLEIVDLGKLPIGSGLGSSAAFAHAIFLSLIKHFNIQITKQELFELVQESEKFAHGNPSGVDATAVVYGGLIEFVRDNNELVINHLDIDHHDLKKSYFQLIDSGRPLETTKDMVALVHQKTQTNSGFKSIVKKIGDVTRNLVSGVKENQFEKEYLRENQRRLEELGVVGQRAQEIVRQIEDVGGVAKITGAGGIQAGSGIILAFSDDEEKLADLIHQNNWKSYSAKIG
jgi:mevalonate kinase